MAIKLVIFGITGDLSTRTLLPALEHILDSGECGELEIIGVSRRELNVAELLASSVGHSKHVAAYSGFTLDLSNIADYHKLREHLSLSGDDQALMYLSVPPSAAADIVDFLGQAGLNSQNITLLLEKPFGFDLNTAQDFIERTAMYFSEEQIYRIDHYMAKEISSEIIRLRSNAENHHRWNNQSITRIDIVASEKIGIENRAVFYEQTGALRDFVQGHLLQLLSLFLIEIPKDFDIRKLPQYRQAALEHIAPVNPTRTLRAQYEGYRQDAHNIGSRIETFVRLELESHHDNWKGVDIRLATGKNLHEKRSVVTISYTDGSSDTFEEAKVRTDNARLPDAYERVLAEAIRGNKSIFTSSPEVLRAWEILYPLQQAWESEQMPLMVYPQGASVQEVVDATISVE